MTNKEFSRLLRKLVNDSGISYKELARRVGIVHSTILAWANAQRSPRMDVVGKVLNELGYKLEVVKK